MRYTTALFVVSLMLPAAFAAAPAPAQSLLSVERLFSGTDLSGPRLRAPEFSPDGRYVTFLQGKPDDKDQLDLWAFDTRSGEPKLLVDSRAFAGNNERLSAEEEARRERQRTASLRGIVEYKFSADGRRLLVPLGGDLYLYDFRAKANPVRQLTRTDAYETDARFSPRGRYVSFVRDQDLFVLDIDTGVERALTSDGEGLIQNGVAEFVAQEEMDRTTGYWWSPDEHRIAFTRIDDTPVQEFERLEINADGARVSRQRYPAAGTANTHVELKVVELKSGTITPIDIDFDDGYLARVNWFRDSQHLAVQKQTRDQKKLELLKVHATRGNTRVLLTESSPAWIELHDDLRFLEQRDAFIWASRRSGYRHLYLYDLDGTLIRQLTDGPWMVVGDGTENGVVGIDETRALVYFTANEASPLERHLYVASLTTKTPGSPRRISREAGWHSANLMPGGRLYLDQWSSPDQPPTASLRSLDGNVHRWLERNALDASHPYHPFVARHSKEEFGSIKAADGQDLYFRLIKPPVMEPGRRYPVVIDVYGGPQMQYVRKDWMGGARAVQGYFRQVLAQNGFVVFSLDNRGSGFRGETFDTAISGRLGKIEIEDQLRGVEFLKGQPFVDSERIGIMGWSYGGYMSLLALTTTKAFKAGVAGAPVTDWRLYDTHYTERYLGMPDVGNGYEVSGVLPYADSLHGHLLLVHGMADDNVLFTHSTMLMQRLQTLDTPFDVMTYPGSKHGLTRMPQTGRHYYEMVLRFFGRTLGESN
ncbi:S9 family peptidase [Povalibacter sp.]|uniref:S9 family peptidase n=1 Tax=Povalibacter sp. TaxID=1962978 RepID=UPI002F40CDED